MATKTQLESAQQAPTAVMSRADAKTYCTAGNAVFTIVSKKTGARFTYLVECPEKDADGAPATPVRWLSVLTGSNNEVDYTFAGSVVGGRFYKHSPKAKKIGADAPSVRAFVWTLEHVLNGDSDQAEIWHHGRCGHCGRKLTDPESIARGIGPKCAAHG